MSLLLAVACREPLSTEQFITGHGPYVFSIDLSDTCARYDFDLYTALDGSREQIQALQGVLLRAEWRTPSDSLFAEKVYLPLTGDGRARTSRQIYESYREGMVPAQAGLWTLTIRQEDRSQVVPMRGLGLVVKKTYGTR